LVKNPYIDANLRRANNLDMTIVEITGGMLRAARSLTGLSQQELADRASISSPCLTAWEGSSGSVPNAGVRPSTVSFRRFEPLDTLRVAVA
jgi:DNA-binding transcriptional regulator YiaG